MESLDEDDKTLKAKFLRQRNKYFVRPATDIT